MKSSKDIPTTKLVPIHPVRSQAKVDELVNNFDPELASPILVGDEGRLLNGTHRYRAFLIRDMKGLTPNFEFAYLEDLTSYVASEIKEILSRVDLSGESDDTQHYVDLDSFWNDNWEFA